MTPSDAAAEVLKLQALYDSIISGQNPSEIVADGYTVKNGRPDLARLAARIAALEAIANPSCSLGQAIGIRF